MQGPGTWITLPADWYLPALLSLTVLTKILRFTQDDEWEAWLPSHQPPATSDPRPKGPSTITSACPFHKIIK